MMPEVTNIHAEQVPKADTPTTTIVAVRDVVVKDARGRSLTVRRLGPLQRTRMFKVIGPTNSSNAALVGHYSLAVSVVAIGDGQIAFPQRERDIEEVLDKLGDDGLDAVAAAWKDNGWVNLDEGDPANIKN